MSKNFFTKRFLDLFVYTMSMKIEYIQDRIESNYDGSDEDIEFYYEYFCDHSLVNILSLYLNGISENAIAKDFENIHTFPQRHSCDLYCLISTILSDLHVEILFYYEQAFKKRNNDFDNIRIAFNDMDYLLFQDALDRVRTIFLQKIPKKLLFTFLQDIIFRSNFRTSPDESLFKQKGLSNTINYYAFVFFIQNDLLNIDIHDLYTVKNKTLETSVKIRPFFDLQSTIKKNIGSLFYESGNIGINNAKHVTREERLERIFYVHLITKYTDIYFEKSNNENNIKNNEVYSELRKLGYKFSDSDTKDNFMDGSLTADASVANKYLVDDMERIERIKMIDLETINYLDKNYF